MFKTITLNVGLYQKQPRLRLKKIAKEEETHQKSLTTHFEEICNQTSYKQNYCRTIKIYSSYLIVLRKCWNISVMSLSHSRSSMTTHDLTLATVSRIISLLLYDLLDWSFKFSKDDTINWKTSWIKQMECYWRANITKNNEKANFKLLIPSFCHHHKERLVQLF